MSRDQGNYVLGFGSYQEAKAKGRNLGNTMADDVVAVLDKAIEEWFSEHTSMDRDSEWVQAYIRIVREEALLQLGGLVRGRAQR